MDGGAAPAGRGIPHRARDRRCRDRPAAERAVAGRVDRIVATCTDEMFELARLGAPRRRTAVVPCGVDTAEFTPDGPVHPRSDRPRIVALNRLVRRKGVDEVIVALRRLPGVELVELGAPSTARLVTR